MIYFNMDFRDSIVAMDLLWAEDDAIRGGQRTRVWSSFRGMDGCIWVQEDHIPHLQSILDTHSLPYTTSTTRTPNSPFVEPFLAAAPR